MDKEETGKEEMGKRKKKTYATWLGSRHDLTKPVKSTKKASETNTDQFGGKLIDT